MKTTPHKLSDITLSTWVGYQNTYGQALDNRLIVISRMPQGEERQNEILLHSIDLHLRNYAYYTGTPLDTIDNADVAEICKIQGAAFIAQKKEAVLLNHKAVFTWNNDVWKIQPIYPATDKLSKKQYDMVTDIALIISDLQDGRHEALYELCAAYLRHPGEVYSSELLEERKELMKELPLNIAVCVKMYMEFGIKELGINRQVKR